MKYSNPQPRDGINVGKRHPLADFFRLLVATVVIIGTLVIGIAVFIGWAVKFIPIEFEQELAGRVDVRQIASGTKTDVNGPEAKALQRLADRLVTVMDLPPGMTVTVHYVDNDTINAFATIGGHLLFFRGLVSRMPDENALAMVMAHEIAHVRERHAISGLGRGLAVALTVLAITGSSGSRVPDGLIGNVSLASQVNFTRAMERTADSIAIDGLTALYGHAGGGQALFRVIGKAQQSRSSIEFFNTHPNPDNRIAAIAQMASERGYALDGNRTPLDPALTQLAPR